jgi:predicted transcriptional regulator
MRFGQIEGTVKSYNIPITNTILEDKHFQAMGSALWLFIWCIDKMTKIDSEGNGKVLGGKPITYEEIKQVFNISRATYKRWMKALKDAGYISTIRTPNGVQIIVHKAKKGYIKSDGSKMNTDGSKMSHRWVKNEPSNIRLDIDYTKTENENNKGKESQSKERIRNMLLNKGLLKS